MDKIECKKKIKLELKTNYVCFVGNLAPWQGVEYLIQAAPIVLKEIPNTKFLIVGEGIMKEKLLTLVCNLNLLDKFIFTGAVPYENVPLYINASDVCVVYKKPLKSGYSPLKLYEYMACSKPVIASRVEGFEILEQKKSGILVEPENPEELAKVIINLLKYEKLKKKMGKRGRECVVKHHSWESAARRVAKVCKEVIREHRGKKVEYILSYKKFKKFAFDIGLIFLTLVVNLLLGFVVTVLLIYFRDYELGLYRMTSNFIGLVMRMVIYLLPRCTFPASKYIAELKGIKD